MKLRWQSLVLAGIALASAAMGAGTAPATVVRFQFTIPNKESTGSTVKTVDVRLFQAAMPRTVANFLNYLDDNDWDGSVVHRRASPADSGVSVVQGGGYIIPASGLLKTVSGQLGWNYVDVPSDAAIADEPGNGVKGPSNLKGTIAMAKSGPNTVTNEWYFNTTDNTNLDAIDPDTGGFSAFGRILGNGMDVIDLIVALNRINIASPFTALPVQSVATINTQQNVFPKDVVVTNDVRRLNIPEGDYNFDGKVDAADLTVWKTDLGSKVKAEADGNGNGVVDGADLLIWQRTRGQNFAAPAASGVPEPESAALALLATGAFGAMRRRQLAAGQ